MKELTQEKMAKVLRTKPEVWNRWRDMKYNPIDLQYAKLQDAKLQDANLQGANLQDANLQGADLQGADLQGADLQGANLQGANLQGADLQDAKLQGADLQDADLQGADLQGANLQGANLQGADLQGADLQDAKLQDADMSGVEGVMSATQWMRENFAFEDGVYIVFRAEQGQNIHKKPESWKFEAGAVLTEVANPERTTLCGCGVHFATLAWVRSNHPGQTIWKAKIEAQDLPSVIVPFGTDGKARCERLVLIEVVDEHVPEDDASLPF